MLSISIKNVKSQGDLALGEPAKLAFVAVWQGAEPHAQCGLSRLMLFPRPPLRQFFKVKT